MVNIIYSCIAREIDTNVKNIKPDSNLLTDFHIDSITMFQVVTSIEEEFEIEISIREMKALVNVKDLVTLVERKTRER
ncbi:MAG: phosphopantetheine-binding protein [Lachnospirales bacterium]